MNEHLSNTYTFRSEGPAQVKFVSGVLAAEISQSNSAEVKLLLPISSDFENSFASESCCCNPVFTGMRMCMCICC